MNPDLMGTITRRCSTVQMEGIMCSLRHGILSSRPFTIGHG